MDPKNMKYLIPSIVLLILSGLGVFFIFKINNSTEAAITIATPTLTPTSIPTPQPTIIITPTIIPVATSSAKITITPIITPTATSSPTPIPTSTTTSSLLNFKNTDSGFSVDYNSSRKLYQDTESSGSRYTFYSSSGNFAIHVSKSGIWAWINPDRNFNSDLIVSGKNTFRYDIATQTIVDLQSSTKNYTIQCVHNGKAALKTECEEFIKSFTLL
jgi:hypothetical protein